MKAKAYLAHPDMLRVAWQLNGAGKPTCRSAASARFLGRAIGEAGPGVFTGGILKCSR